MKNYSRQYSTATITKQKVYGKRSGGGNGGRLWHALGIVTTVSMLAGIVASICFGLALRSGLSQLAESRKEGSQLHAQNKVLVERRDQLLKEERIIKVAGEMGLFPPASDQIRRP